MSSTISETLATLGRGYVRDAPGSLGKAALATRYLNPWLRDHPRQRLVRTRFGAAMAVDTQDLIQRFVYLFGLWEPHMTHWLQRRLRPGDTYIDVGANVGYFSLLASQLVGEEGRVVAIEASPTFHARVLQHAEINGCNNLRTVNAAVADERKTVTLILASSSNMGAASIVPYGGPAEFTLDVEAYPLPQVLDADDIAGARVIKIDVEGAEGAVIRGLAPVLDKLRPDAEITVEVTPERMENLGDSADELLAIMREHGFHVYRLANSYAPGSYPAALHRPTGVPVRWTGRIAEESDLIFSRVDAERLP
ncbi:methyltransferase, FkbM family [Streptomyces sp. SceaMP-e96]|uniref:FkbM family methyltransferase n=1 Tax=unclassified Streptomyces TaxID=2593676 RepID=UPI00082392F5|nr:MULTISPECIES: FkbM family methyltransferase [unclassified Streptomyces]MYT12309.1 FkbM family methyltransferase [Streptomyces sp. SID4951]SCK28969.1 methyltransferase, FkbM family [Streptomyces sp. SceaMP-e96]